MMRGFAVVIALLAGMVPGWSGAEAAPGTTIDQSNADQVKDLLRPRS